MTRTRLAVIGCGALARQVHLPLLNELAQVVALCDSQEASLTEAQTLCPRAETFSDHQSLLDGSLADAYLVCTSTPEHYRPALDIIRLGLPLYLEKPIAETTEQAEALVAAQRQSRSVVAVGCNFRLNPLYQRLRATLPSQVSTVRSSFTTISNSRPRWVFHSGPTRGTLLELGSHELDLFCSVFGWDIHTVWARCQGQTVVLQMETANGLSYQGLFSLDSMEEARFEVFSSLGKYTVDRYRSWGLDFEAPQTGGVVSRFRSTLAQLRHLSYGLNKLKAPANEVSYRLAWLDFFETLNGQTGQLPGLDDGLKIMQLIDAAEQSIETNSPVSIQEMLNRPS